MQLLIVALLGVAIASHFEKLKLQATIERLEATNAGLQGVKTELEGVKAELENKVTVLQHKIKERQSADDQLTDAHDKMKKELSLSSHLEAQSSKSSKEWEEKWKKENTNSVECGAALIKKLGCANTNALPAYVADLCRKGG